MKKREEVRCSRKNIKVFKNRLLYVEDGSGIINAKSDQVCRYRVTSKSEMHQKLIGAFFWMRGDASKNHREKCHVEKV